MAQFDPYEVLGVPRTAGPDDIKSAYRRLARRYHPDVNQGDPSAEEHFKEIGHAYSILSDAEKRARYDQFGVVDDQPQGDPFFMQGSGFSDLFDMFFGAAPGSTGRRGRGRDGADIRADVTITLNDVQKGTERDVEVDRLAECETCHGLGTKDGRPPDQCATCKGRGMVSTVRNVIIGQVQTTMPCPTCGGSGVVIKDRCEVCHGEGLRPQSDKVHVKIPPGVETGMSVQYPGQGNDGTLGGRPGDLYVLIRVADDSRFHREGQQLFANVRVSVAQAILGDQIAIEGLDGPIEVDIHPGTQPGTEIPIHGEGLPPLHGGRRGDFTIVVQVNVPAAKTETQAKLIREFAEHLGEAIPAGPKQSLLGGLFGRKK